MTAPRSRVPTEALRAGSLSFGGEGHHHAGRVLRMKAGEKITLMDGKGRVGHGEVTSVGAARTGLDKLPITMIEDGGATRAREWIPTLRGGHSIVWRRYARTGVEVEETDNVSGERPRLHILQGLTRGNRMDGVAHRGAEPGAAARYVHGLP